MAEGPRSTKQAATANTTINGGEVAAVGAGDSGQKAKNNAQGKNAEVSGGEVDAFDTATWNERQFGAQTARKIALMLLWIMIFSIAVHYTVVVYAQWNGEKEVVAEAAKIFGVWLPMLSGFVGTTLAFYFAKK